MYRSIPSEKRMTKGLLIAAAGSGFGKSTIAMGLLKVLKRRGLSVRSFKCGPDYIDPMFHRAVLGVACRNLDTYLMGEDEVLDEVRKAGESGCLCVAEGAMGLYDGLGGSLRHSAYSIALLCDLPVLALLDVREGEFSEASSGNAGWEEQLDMLVRRDSGRRIRAVLLNRCSGAAFPKIRETIQDRYPGIVCCGYLPYVREAVLSSRHLGLVTAAEVNDLDRKIDAIADSLERCSRIGRILEIAGMPCASGAIRMETEGRDAERKENPERECKADREAERKENRDAERRAKCKADACRIAVARDEAFCFMYQRALENLEMAGAEICYFSPLHDRHLPEDVSGLYLPGGYPELHLKELSENHAMKNEIARMVRAGFPVIAECGGFLYLGKEILGEDGQAYEMAHVFEGSASRQKKLVRFGYLELSCGGTDCLLLKDTERMRAHEFHYWDSTENGEDLIARKETKNLEWRCGYVNDHMYAAFPHIYLDRARAERFVNAGRGMIKHGL